MTENAILAIIAVSITLFAIAIFYFWRTRMSLPSSPDEVLNEPTECEKPKSALNMSVDDYHQWIARLQRPTRNVHSSRQWFKRCPNKAYSVNSIGILALVFKIPLTEIHEVIEYEHASDYFKGVISIALGELEEQIYLWGEAGYSSVEIAALIEAYVERNGGIK